MTEPKARRRKTPPAKTIEGRENQLINKAMNLAEEQIEHGTATSQVITHFLKLGTTRERLEQDKLRRENDLLRAKVEHLEQAKVVEELYADALRAMKTYSGQEDEGVD